MLANIHRYRGFKGAVAAVLGEADVDSMRALSCYLPVANCMQIFNFLFSSLESYQRAKERASVLTATLEARQ